MLVSHKHKFIYTKTVKTASTSVEAYFEPFCMPGTEWTFNHERDESVSESGIVGFRGDKPPEGCVYWHHMPATLIRENVGEEVWDEYFKFCVIRNPFDKAVSAFYFFQRGKNESNESVDLDHERVQFEDWLLHSNQLPIDRNKYVIDGQFCLNAVVRYEALATDVEWACNQLGIPWDPSSLPTLKGGIRPKDARAADLYTDKSKKIIETAYALELENFQYSFPAGD